MNVASGPVARRHAAAHPSVTPFDLPAAHCPQPVENQRGARRHGDAVARPWLLPAGPHLLSARASRPPDGSPER
ncbi:hypothetical protein SBRY_50479 [Actinacidiphila bryophytorum]|uniref:Uncharacterized protein n=1 Tax=Actinacidiphila bryophytorum TaxID=1436133 RepID=A0A9W4H508_9ACTN|nr:hypothetical protein SBRY_50479 [Actinacidiphila bryophytorum]